MADMTILEAMNWIQSNPNSLGDVYGQLYTVQTGLNQDLDDPYLQGQRDYLVGEVQAAKDEQQQEAFDSGEFGAAACDCEPGEPCCMRAFKVHDSAAPSRKIDWRLAEGAPEKLFMITKEATGGRASANVTVEYEEWETCKLGLKDKPRIFAYGFHDDDTECFQEKRAEKTVTTPLQLPVFNLPFFPTELLQVIWIIQVMMRAATFDEDELPSIYSAQCSDPRGYPIKIVRQGPVNTPIFAFIDKINNAMKGLADECRSKPFEPSVLAPSTFSYQSSLKLEFSVEVLAPTMELKGKGGSPNLELTLNPFGLSFGPAVTGTVDLLDLFLSRIPYGPDIRNRLAHPGGVVSASAECSLTVRGAGLAKLEVLNGATIEIGSAEGWEAEFGKMDTRYAGELKLTGSLKACARLDLRTWFFDASASAGAEVSTGWQFGGRANDRADGTVKWEEIYHFQGILLKAYASVAAGTDTGRGKDRRVSGHVLPAAGRRDESLPPDGHPLLTRFQPGGAARCAPDARRCNKAPPFPAGPCSSAPAGARGMSQCVSTRARKLCVRSFWGLSNTASGLPCSTISPLWI
ncbi:hypothetical protein DC366_12050 [Pelagivirga sediminicola]|uniref:Uncharacterized protein n=1 Tax=Pelagivirga sediminicola TaxID=2170575 RepID=A0A2T7G5Z5_9RHOB|nr:hypothetical protein [Pelagivirga sediminicola]PVA09842.1 hypothetical protein DC366_12050 [Pelagivirga sediminicola]